MTGRVFSAFHGGGGDMGAKVRAFDWASTPLGPLPGWPPALRITVDQMLASKFPACLFWGPDLIAIYNDGYAVILGSKADALGQPLRVTWSEVWDDLKPIAEKALAGESTFIEDFKIHIERNGGWEDAYFTFNYGPVFDEHGDVVGMLDTVVETTGTVLGTLQVQRERERLQSLLQQMPGFAGVVSGPRLVYEWVNDAYLTLAGPRDFIGRTVREVFPEVEGQGFFELLDQVYATGETMQIRAAPVLFEGGRGRRHVDLLFAPIRGVAGAVEGIFIGGYDVTEQVEAQARLRELNADLEHKVIERTLARGKAWQVSPELLSVIGPAGHFEAVNPAWEKTLGWSEGEMVGASYADFVHADDLAPSAAAWADATERCLPVLRFENRYRVKGGGWRWLSWVAVPEDGKVYCITRDVQAERDDAAALAQRTSERDVLAQIVETTGTFIQVLDPQYRFLAINKANIDEYERIYGVRPAVGGSLMDVMGDRTEQVRAALALWGRAMAGESFTVHGEFGDAQRALRHYEMKFEVLRDSGGAPVGAFMSGTDITERLAEQRALLDMQEALRQAQKMEAVGQLTGGIAHDFNNLLAAISGSIQVMQMRLKRGKTDGMERYLEMGDASVRRAAALTQRLLAFSRRQTLAPKPVDAQALVAGMAELISRTVGPSVELAVDTGPGLWPVRADPSQLENALLNLCINARDAMPGGGRLSIVTANAQLDAAAAAAIELPAGDYVRLSVTDTGTGMAPEVAARIFDPFFTTKPLGQGTGLGLSMVYGFVRQSGGQVRVDSTPGRGTSMVIHLPRHTGSAAEEGPAAAAAAEAGSAGETVLLIEDEDNLRQLLREVLGEAGYTVLAVEDGPAGLRMLQAEGRIDLLVTDVGLPGGMNGRQVADAGRSLRPRLKVLFITGYAESAAVGNGLMEPGMEVMTKPFEIAQLAHKVREMLDGA